MKTRIKRYTVVGGLVVGQTVFSASAQAKAPVEQLKAVAPMGTTDTLYMGADDQAHFARLRHNNRSH